MTLFQYSLISVAGIIAGFINTLAGSGSLLVIPLLIFMGLPANVANGTNRVAILLQTVVATSGLKKQGNFELKSSWKLYIPAILGAIAGAMLAVDINEKLMEQVIGGLLLFMFVLILLDPDRWVKGKASDAKPLPTWLQSIIFFGIGVYGGFIQAGVGLFLLAGLVMGAGFDLAKANVLKSFIVLLFTVFALIVFAIHLQIDYKVGIVLSLGNMLGAWLGVKATVSWGPKMIRYVMLVVLLGSAVKLLLF